MVSASSESRVHGQQPYRYSSERLSALLSHERRRLILAILAQDQSLHVADLADRISEAEPARVRSDAESPTDGHHRMRESLTGDHIPRLADAELVGFDAEYRRVRLTDQGRSVYDQLRAARQERRWAWIFATESIVWLGLLMGAWIGLPILSRAPPTWILAGSLLTYLFTALGYQHWTR